MTAATAKRARPNGCACTGVELIRYSWRGEGEARERVEEIAAPAQEIDVKASELVRVKF